MMNRRPPMIELGTVYSVDDPQKRHRVRAHVPGVAEPGP